MSSREFDFFVANVRRRMAALRVNQRELSIRMGVTDSYVSQLLSGKNPSPGLDVIVDVARALETTAHYLLKPTQEKIAS